MNELSKDEEAKDKRLSKDKIFKRLMDMIGCEVKNDKYCGEIMLVPKACSNGSVLVGMIDKDDLIFLRSISMSSLVNFALMHSKSFCLWYYDYADEYGITRDYDGRETMKNPVYGCKTLEEMAMKLDLHSFHHHEWNII